METPDLLASYFTIAGDTRPLAGERPSPFDFRDRVEAAAAAGFVGFGLYHADLAHVIAQYGFPEMRRILNANGMRHVELEALMDWFADGDRRKESDVVRDLLLRSAEELGASHFKCAGDLVGDWPLASIIEEFDKLCAEAARAGTRVAFEMVAISNVASLDRVMEIITKADRPNGGLMLDIWHVYRGGISYADVAMLPGDRIFGVEVNDASVDLQGSLVEDTICNRRFCGEGDFEVPTFLEGVRNTGYSGAYGIEVLSNELRKMPLDEAVSKAFSTTLAQFDLSGSVGLDPRSPYPA